MDKQSSIQIARSAARAVTHEVAEITQLLRALPPRAAISQKETGA